MNVHFFVELKKVFQEQQQQISRSYNRVSEASRSKISSLFVRENETITIISFYFTVISQIISVAHILPEVIRKEILNTYST